MVLTKDAEKIKLEEKRTTGAMKQIADWLGLASIRRAEAYDISNTSGVESVGSMVVFEDGRPKKNDYRKFNHFLLIALLWRDNCNFPLLPA